MEKYPSGTRIILALKEKGKMNLKELSGEIGISKMAVLNHVQKLESQGLVERSLVKSSVGRPYYVFSASEKSKDTMASSDSMMLDDLLDYLDRTGNREIAENYLRDRYDQVRADYGRKLGHYTGDRRVEALARLRDEENYYPELKSGGKGAHELLEYNCPIFKISNRFGIACSLETQLFSSVLDMDVTSTHRQVNGSDVCKFLIRKKKD